MGTELADRETDGFRVVLVWHREKDELTVEVFDRRGGDHFALAVDGSRALDAFHHPYAYASHLGIEYQADAPIARAA